MKFDSVTIRHLLVDLLQTAIWVLVIMALTSMVAPRNAFVFYMGLTVAALFLSLRANRRHDE